MKQVIIIRKDLNMRKGKFVAQGCHASRYACDNTLTKDIVDWEVNYGQAKIVVGVDSLEELLELQQKAFEAGLPTGLVIDSGKTEFKEPTITALAIGPADVEDVSALTGHLKLL